MRPRSASHTASQGEDQQPEPVGARAEDLVGEHRAEGYEHAAADQPRGQADVDGAHHRVDEDELPTLLQLMEGLTEVDARSALLAQLALREREAGDHERREQEGERVDVEGHADATGAEHGQRIDVAQLCRHLGEQGEETCGDGHRAVRGYEGERVGRGEVISGHQVRDRRLFGRGPQQREALEHERSDHEPEHRVDEREGDQHGGTADVARHHDLLAVEPVGHHPRRCP